MVASLKSLNGLLYGLNSLLIPVLIKQIRYNIFFLRHPEFLSYGGFTDIDCRCGLTGDYTDFLCRETGYYKHYYLFLFGIKNITVSTVECTVKSGIQPGIS